METNDMLIAEKSLVESILGDTAILISKTEYMTGNLSCWKNERSLPTRKVCSFIGSTCEVIIPNVDSEAFASIFSKIRPDLSDVKDICRLIEMMSPSLRKAINHLYPYMTDIARVWHLPRYDGEIFEAFVDNSTSGKIEKITIDRQFQLKIESVGTGMRFDLM